MVLKFFTIRIIQILFYYQNEKNQAIYLNKSWDDIDNIELVIVSPLKRTLETVLLIFQNKNI